MLVRNKIGLVAVVLATSMAMSCGIFGKKKKKSSDNSDSSSVSGSGGGVGGTSDPNSATLNVSATNASGGTALVDENGMALDATTTTVACAVPGTTAAAGCTAQPDPTTGEVVMPKSCVTTADTTCQISASGTVVSNLPMNVNPTGQTIVNVDADTGTGATNQQQVDGSGNPVAAGTPSVPAAVQALKIAPGVYSMTYCKGKTADADGNKFPDLAACGSKPGGWTQSGYINFTAGTATSWPVLDLWRSADAFNSCQVNGAVSYSISDGTNTYAPTLDASNQFDALDLDAKMIAYSWIPAGAAIRFAYSNPALAPKQSGGDNQKTIAVLQAAYPGQDACAGLATDLAKAWDAATLSHDKGGFSCTGVTVSTPATAMNQMFSTSPDFLHKCGNYKAKKNGYSKAKFQAECSIFLAGDQGKQQQAQSQLQLVDTFLQSLSNLRHSGGDDRMKPLKAAFTALPADLSTLDPASAAYDTQLIGFLKLWAGLSWDWNITHLAPDVIKNFTTAIAPDSKKPFLHDYVGKTGRAVLIGWLQDPTTATNIDQLICNAGSNSAENLQAAFELIGGKPSIATLLGDFGPMNAGAAWKAGVTTTQMCADLLAVYTDALAATGIPHCAKTQLTSMKQQLTPSCTDQTQNAWISYAVNAAGYTNQLNQVKTTLAGLSSFTKGADGTYTKNAAYTDAMGAADLTALETAVKTLSAYAQGQFVTQMLQQIDGGRAGADSYSKLYQLTQGVVDMISRDSFGTDLTYRNTMLAIQQNSKCLPDAVVQHDPVINAANAVTFKALVRSPVFRQFSAPVELSPNSSATTTYFEAVDQKLQTGGDCTWGNKQDLNNMSVDANGNITASLIEAWIQCNQGQGASAPQPNVAFIKAVPEATN